MSYITIPELPSLTAQQVFDMSVAHVRKNGKPSVTESNNPNVSVAGTCVYSGIGCAAAPFIRKGQRVAADQYGSWGGLRNENLVPVEHSVLIRGLQKCHDQNAWEFIEGQATRIINPNFMSEFEASVRELARQNSLIYQEPQA